MEKIVKEIIQNKQPCYFVSPHLDDAAFSAGGLISYLAKKTKVVVITAFTKAGRNNHSLSALAYVRQCRYKKNEISRFFSARRKEDKELFNNLGAEVIHLGFPDALWRKKKNLNLMEKFSTLFINDFRYIYPTHRLHIAKGKIFKEDRENVEKLQKRLEKIIGSEIPPARCPEPLGLSSGRRLVEGTPWPCVAKGYAGGARWDKRSLVFCPLGLGKHVDHIVVREACTNVFPNVIYWEDSPYNLYHQLEKDFIKKKGLKRKVFAKNQSVRKSLYPAYKTQFGKLFEGKTGFNLPPETYYFL